MSIPNPLGWQHPVRDQANHHGTGRRSRSAACWVVSFIVCGAMVTALPAQCDHDLGQGPVAPMVVVRCGHAHRPQRGHISAAAAPRRRSWAARNPTTRGKFLGLFWDERRRVYSTALTANLYPNDVKIFSGRSNSTADGDRMHPPGLPHAKTISFTLSSLKGWGVVVDCGDRHGLKGVLSCFDLDGDSAELTPVSRWSVRSAARDGRPCRCCAASSRRRGRWLSSVNAPGSTRKLLSNHWGLRSESEPPDVQCAIGTR